jgi:hypothetical protein
MDIGHACEATNAKLFNRSSEAKKYDPTLIVKLAEGYGQALRESFPAAAVVSWYQHVMLGMKGADPQLKGGFHRKTVERLLALLKLDPVPAEWNAAFGVLDAQRLWLMSWFGLVQLTTDRVWPASQPSFSQMIGALKDTTVLTAEGWDERKWGRIKTTGELVYETIHRLWREAEESAVTSAEAERKAAGMLLVLHLVVHYVGIPEADPKWKWSEVKPYDVVTLAPK